MLWVKGLLGQRHSHPWQQRQLCSGQELKKTAAKLSVRQSEGFASQLKGAVVDGQKMEFRSSMACLLSDSILVRGIGGGFSVTCGKIFGAPINGLNRVVVVEQ